MDLNHIEIHIQELFRNSVELQDMFCNSEENKELNSTLNATFFIKKNTLVTQN